ncbi:AAA family ATPase [Salinimicrobium terrae]|uniref:AAA family ATPase n=1 Tax=Salinimicrobium terrae TaxID=470866 RepID=UPI0003F82C8C|nr:ATP-binding protein [Salinimicrobium terrae]
MEEELKQRRARGLIRIVLFGPESTGKTTLAQLLASHYQTEWIPEFMREYLQKKWDEQREICEPHDLLPIARAQMALENRAAATVGELLFCDTNLLELVVYSRAYYNETVDPTLLKHALKAQYDLYFLTYIDVPWVEDDLRDRPEDREKMFARFRKTLDEHNLPYRVLKGDLQQRFETAVKIIDQLKKHKIGL